MPSRADARGATRTWRAALAACVLGASAVLAVATSAHAASATAATPRPHLDAARVEAAASAVRADPDLGGVRRKAPGASAIRAKPDPPTPPLPWLVGARRAGSPRAVGSSSGCSPRSWSRSSSSTARRWLAVHGDSIGTRGARLPSHVRELDIRPESLPADIGAAVRELWLAGERRAALSLLYRGALSRLVHSYQVAIGDASTEGDCVRLARAALPPPRGDFVDRPRRRLAARRLRRSAARDRARPAPVRRLRSPAAGSRERRRAGRAAGEPAMTRTRLVPDGVARGAHRRLDRLVHALDRMGRGRRSHARARRGGTRSLLRRQAARPPPRRIGDDGARPRASAARRRDARHRLASLEHVPRARGGAAALDRRRAATWSCCRAPGRPRATRRAGCRCEARICAATRRRARPRRPRRRSRPAHRATSLTVVERHREAVALRRLRRARRDRSRLRRAAPLSSSAARRSACCTPARRPGCFAAARAPSPRASATASGDITANALEGSFDNARARARRRRPRVRGDAAAARRRRRLVLRRGDARALPRRCSGTTARRRSLLAAAAILLLLWRSGTRFGPLIADTARARRSVGEQVRRTAAFIAAGGGAALHRASIRALEEEARRSIAGYADLLGARERAEAIARTTRERCGGAGRGDEPAAAPGPAPPRRGDRAARARPSRPPSGSRADRRAAPLPSDPSLP